MVGRDAQEAVGVFFVVSLGLEVMHVVGEIDRHEKQERERKHPRQERARGGAATQSG